ncbi:MAG TPA: DUF6660 family protein [Chitinophagaceae bacterium]|nr:DUF6660 family protein [Chitinophagaceae bacterium]
MKVVSFILAVYLILLFAIPCCSFDNCPEEKIVQTENHEMEDDDCGNCSPFFSCAGCSGVTHSYSNTYFEMIPQDPINQYTGFILSSTPDVHYDFWQPPKLT